MLNLTEQKATLAELELLVAVRFRVLRAANQLPEDTPLPEVESQTRTYYQKAFAENTHTAYLLWDGETLAGTGAVSYFQVMPTVHNPHRSESLPYESVHRTAVPAAGHCDPHPDPVGGGCAPARGDGHLSGSDRNGQAAV